MTVVVRTAGRVGKACSCVYSAIGNKLPEVGGAEKEDAS